MTKKIEHSGQTTVRIRAGSPWFARAQRANVGVEPVGGPHSASGPVVLSVEKRTAYGFHFYSVMKGRRGKSSAENSAALRAAERAVARAARREGRLRQENENLKKQLADRSCSVQSASAETADHGQFAEDLAWADARVRGASGSGVVDPVKDFIENMPTAEFRELVDSADAIRERALSESLAKVRRSK